MANFGESIEPGIYLDMEEEAYHEADGLSCSGMKDLSVSPLRYWHRHINPEFEREDDGGARRFGKAVHCLALEPERFSAAYALKLDLDDFPGALQTTDDMKAWLVENQLPKSGKRKQDLIDRIAGSGIPATIWDLELKRHAEENEGKTFLGKEESRLIRKASEALAADPYAVKALTGGMPEVSFFIREPSTGIMLKARMDYVKPRSTIDVKTFSNSRGKATDRAVFEAIYYEGYYLQCVFYSYVRELCRQALASGEIEIHGAARDGWVEGFLEAQSPPFGFVFVESSEPFDLRIVQLRRGDQPGVDANIYWGAAERKIAEMITLYADCRGRFGDRPWREARPPHVLVDTDMPQLIFT
ncbi:MAG: hypothetical protein BGO49_24565 [Planctomycetales bacterium 71-10]|nr:MAG: hypothetical protein BGO49_24565 [Planctomycetales bacterium 71-10]